MTGVRRAVAAVLMLAGGMLPAAVVAATPAALDCAPGGVKLNTLTFDIVTTGTISGGTMTPEI